MVEGLVDWCVAWWPGNSGSSDIISANRYCDFGHFNSLVLSLIFKIRGWIK